MNKISVINYVLLPMGVLVGMVLAIGLTSMAEDSELDTGPRVIPYNGVLEFNGSPLNGQADLRFTLTDDPSGENVNCLFEEEHDNITAYAGRFSVNIGAVAGDLPDCAFDSEAIYIEVGVRDAESVDDYVALNGSQRIHPVPFSYWAAEGSDFKVDGGLKVGGDVLTGTFADAADEGTAGMRVVGGGQNRPVFWAGQFTVDSEDGSGLLNLVAGSHATANNNYAYNSGRGTVRINMNDDSMSFYAGTDEEPASGNTVTWGEYLRFHSTSGISSSTGNVIINDTLEANGNINSNGNITAGADGSGGIFANGSIGLGDGGVLYASGNTVTVDDSLQVNGRVDINNAVVIGADGSGSLDIATNLTVQGDTTLGDTEINGTLSSSTQLLSYRNQTDANVDGSDRDDNNWGNSAGTVLTDSSGANIAEGDGVCFLTKVTVDGVQNGEHAGCRAWVRDGVWVGAFSGNGSSGDCEFHCITW